MSSPQTSADDWVTALIRDFQDKLTGGLYEAIYGLDGPALDTLMRCQAHACVAAFLELSDLRGPMGLDEFLSAMRTAGPSKVAIARDGDVITWTELHEGQCVCPFVRRGVVRLDEKLCICGAAWVERLFQVVAGTPVRVETVETVAAGAQNCTFRITPLPATS